MQNKFLLFLVLLLNMSCHSFTHAQGLTARVAENSPVNIPFKNYVIGEPHVAVNPNNPDHLVAGAMLIDPDGTEDAPCISLYSKDGGKTWSYHIFRYTNAADPWCVINQNGEAVFSLLGGDDLWVYHSGDGGKTWTDSTDLGTGHDHEAMTTTVDKNGALVVYINSVQSIKKESKDLSAIFLARSEDGGKTFPLRKRIVHNNLSLNTMTPVVLSDGTLLVSYDEFSYKTATGYKRLEGSLSWIITSKDGGETFSHPRFITQSFGPSFAVLKGDKDDRLYWIGRSKDGKSILLFYSADKGETWTETAVYTSANLNTIPNIAITKEGIVGVSFYERNEGEVFVKHICLPGRRMAEKLFLSR